MGVLFDLTTCLELGHAQSSPSAQGFNELGLHACRDMPYLAATLLSHNYLSIMSHRAEFSRELFAIYPLLLFASPACKPYHPAPIGKFVAFRISGWLVERLNN